MLEIAPVVLIVVLVFVPFWVFYDISYRKGYMDACDEAKKLLYDELQESLADAKKESANDARG